MEIGRITLIRSIDDITMEKQFKIEAVDPMGDPLDLIEILGMLDLARKHLYHTWDEL